MVTFSMERVKKEKSGRQAFNWLRYLQIKRAESSIAAMAPIKKALVPAEEACLTMKSTFLITFPCLWSVAVSEEVLLLVVTGNVNKFSFGFSSISWVWPDGKERPLPFRERKNLKV